MEESLLIIKPDAVKRGLVGDILEFLLGHQFAIVFVKQVMLDRDEAFAFYSNKTKDWLERKGRELLASYQDQGIDAVQHIGVKEPLDIGQLILQWAGNDLLSGEVAIVLVRSENAVQRLRKLAVPAKSSVPDQDTIRGHWVVDSIDEAFLERRIVHAVVHASDSENEVYRETTVLRRHLQTRRMPEDRSERIHLGTGLSSSAYRLGADGSEVLKSYDRLQKNDLGQRNTIYTREVR